MPQVEPTRLRKGITLAGAVDARRRQKRPRTRLLTAYVALRMTERAADLGRVDWLLWGTRHNPYAAGTQNHKEYNLAYDHERRNTQKPQATRIRPTGPAAEILEQ